MGGNFRRNEPEGRHRCRFDRQIIFYICTYLGYLYLMNVHLCLNHHLMKMSKVLESPNWRGLSVILTNRCDTYKPNGSVSNYVNYS